MDNADASHMLRAQRLAARSSQQQVEHARLVAHRRIGRELLSVAAAEQAKRIAAALREVDRWETDRLCSDDYIAQWRDWLALPVDALVASMCSDDGGWGCAMRQNSPFSAANGYGYEANSAHSCLGGTAGDPVHRPSPPNQHS